MKEGLEEYRKKLAEEINAEPDKQKRREILQSAKEESLYQEGRETKIAERKGNVENYAVRKAVRDFFLSQDTYLKYEIIKLLEDNPKIVSDPETRRLAQKKFTHLIAHDNVTTPSDCTKLHIIFRFDQDFLHSEEVQRGLKKKIIEVLKSNGSSYVKQYGIYKMLNPNTLQSPEIKDALLESAIVSIPRTYGGSYYLEQDMTLLGIQAEEASEIYKKALVIVLQRACRNGDTSILKILRDDRGISDEKILQTILEEVKIYQPNGVENYLEKFESFAESNKRYFDLLSKTPDQASVLTKEDLPSIEALSLSLVEAEEIKRTGTDLKKIADSKDYQGLFTILKSNSQEWVDEQNISGPFEKGAEIFGYDRMFAYINRTNLSRHDALHAFQNITSLYNASGLKPNQFYGNILNQVKLDDKTYEAGTAHHHFNELAVTLNLDFSKTLELAKRYKDIVSLQDLIVTLESPKKIFESWNNLKRYADLTKILEQREILEELKQLKDTGQEKLYKYIEKLAFHPSSKVDMQAVIQFWREPGIFLSGSDTHTPEGVHNRKKPSNYTEIPNLDLTAEELRDALVEGNMDTLQVFTPLEITYKIKINGKEQIFVAKINRKSDPDGVLAGNDTACCMPFGEGKNTVYTFNPNVTLFTLQVERSDRTRRTIAQSVLTKDKDIGIRIPEIIDQLKQIGEHLTEVVSEDILKKSPAYLACDNVEVARNYQESEYTVAIEAVYRDFFTEYMSRFGQTQGFRTEKVIIGQGYSDALTHLPSAPNTYAPLAPVGYSDKTGERVFILDLKQEGTELHKKVTTFDIPSRQDIPVSTRGVSYLTFEDTLPVAYLEGKVYSDNQSLLVYLHNIENGLIAKDINNAAKGRPNMSLKYTDVNGYTKGYILAYEGSLSDHGDRYEDEEYETARGTGEPIIYIADLAADKENKTAGGRLIQAFTELYKKNYLEKGKLIPIFAQARETTTYKIIQKQLEKLGHDLGISFKLEELPVYQSGHDTMHPVIIRATH